MKVSSGQINSPIDSKTIESKNKEIKVKASLGSKLRSIFSKSEKKLLPKSDRPLESKKNTQREITIIHHPKPLLAKMAEDKTLNSNLNPSYNEKDNVANQQINNALSDLKTTISKALIKSPTANKETHIQYIKSRITNMELAISKIDSIIKMESELIKQNCKISTTNKQQVGVLNRQKQTLNQHVENEKTQLNILKAISLSSSETNQIEERVNANNFPGVNKNFKIDDFNAFEIKVATTIYKSDTLSDFTKAMDMINTNAKEITNEGNRDLRILLEESLATKLSDDKFSQQVDDISQLTKLCTTGSASHQKVINNFYKNKS